MFLALTMLAMLAIGLAVVVRVWPDRRELAGAELGLYAFFAGSAIWVASTWCIALASQLRTPVVIARAVLLLVAAVLLLLPELRRAGSRQVDSRDAAILGIAAIPILLVAVVALWRGAVVPPLTHDALSYHLPKAVLYMRAAGYDGLESLQWLLNARPANYELLLADALVSDGTDKWTEWVSTFFYLGFILAAVALAERWWGRSTAAAAAVAMLTAGVPVLLLHSSAHKNDVMASFFAVCGVVATGRFFATGERRSLALLMVAFAAAAGTKTNMAIVAVAIAPIVLWRLFRKTREGESVAALGAIVAAAFAAFLVLGGWVFAERVLPRPAGSGTASAPSAPTAASEASWGQWENVWQAPYIMLTAPFSNDSRSLRVPWDSRRWFWRRDEIYFSHDGGPFVVAVLLLPLAIWLLRGRGRNPAERNLVSLAVLAAFIVHLPVRLMPLGMLSISLPRFTLFIIPVVFAWTAAPAMRWISEHRRTLEVPVLAALALVFLATAADYAVEDDFAPLSYALWASAHPGTRVVPFDPNRAGEIADRLAAPSDKIAVFAGTSSWIHPLFGRQLSRPVVFLPPTADPSRIPADAKWVVFDSHFEVTWQGPAFRTLGDYAFGTGGRSPQVLGPLDAVRADPRFQPIVVHRRSMQAVFRRR